MRYEIHVNHNIIDKIVCIDNNKIIEIKEHTITDNTLREKINNIRSWIKIHPVGKYIFGDKEYNEYKEFMTNKQYLNVNYNIINPNTGKVYNPKQ